MINITNTSLVIAKCCSLGDYQEVCHDLSLPVTVIMPGLQARVKLNCIK